MATPIPIVIASDFPLGKSLHFCYLRFTVENPRGFSRNETIAKHIVAFKTET